MYTVNGKPFVDFFDAIHCCKCTPKSSVIAEDGRVLMKNTDVSIDTMIDVSMAKVIFKLQNFVRV